MDLSARSLQLHSGDADGCIHPWDLASTHPAATGAATRTASPSRTHSLPASLTADGNSPSSLPATLRPASSPAPLKGRRSVCESDSSCHSASESYSSSCVSCSTVSGSHHSQCLDIFPLHAQHTQHAGRSNLDATRKQRQQSTAGTACESSLANQLPALSQDWLPTELEEAGAPTATAAEVSSWAGPEEPAAATAQLTAQRIRQRYPHLFGPDCNTISLQSACDAVVCSKSERDSSNGLNTAVGRIALAASSLQESPSTAPGASSSDSAAEDSNTCSTAVVSQGQGSEVLRAGQDAGQQGQHAATLHESPLRLLLKESRAAVAGAIQAGMQGALPLTCSTAAYCSHRSLTSPWAGRCEALLQLVIHLSIQLVNQSAT